MRLFLVDGIFVPGTGVWSFVTIDNKDAVDGIQRAFDSGALVNMIAAPEKALRLSKITNRNIIVGDQSRQKSDAIESSAEPGDMVLMYYEQPQFGGNGKRAMHRHFWISSMLIDIFTEAGIAGLMARALPEGQDIVEWGSGIVAWAEHVLRERGEVEAGVDVGDDGEVPDEE